MELRMRTNLERIVSDNCERNKKRKEGVNEKNLREIRQLLWRKKYYSRVLKNFNLPLSGDNVRRHRE